MHIIQVAERKREGKWHLLKGLSEKQFCFDSTCCFMHMWVVFVIKREVLFQNCSWRVFLQWLAVHGTPGPLVQIRWHPAPPVEHLTKQHLKCSK